MILVSACLAGVNCSYDGKHRLNPDIKKLVDERKAIAVCPEVLGGRPIPRKKTEILNGKVFDEDGLDVTYEFIKGANLVLDIVKKNNIKKAILKSKSPSCGVGKIYDGSFKGILVDGYGVTAALLKKHGVECQNI